MLPIADDSQNLRRCVRDLVALSTLPAIWGNADRLSIGRSLAEVLVRILSVDFVYVRLHGRAGEVPVEAARTRQRTESVDRARQIGQALGPWLQSDNGAAPLSIPSPVGEGTVRLEVLTIGYAHDYGVLAAGCGRPDFPTDTERLLLGVAVNQAAGLLQRKETEEALWKQTEWLRVTLTSIGDAVITTDVQGRVTSLNPVAETLTGWSQDEARGQLLETVFCILNEQSRQPVGNPVATVLEEGRVIGQSNGTILIARDGTERPIDDSAAPIRAARGEIIGAVLIFRDVTEQRRAEWEVRHSEARKAAILATALDCIITCDQHGNVVEFNPAAERTFGYSRAEVIGRDMADFIIPPSLRERHRQGMARYLATGEAILLNRRIELTARRADGTEFPAELAITHIPTPGPAHFTAYLRDISERKRRERRRGARLAVTQVLAQAATLEEAVPRILQAVCESLDWDMGAFWTVDRQANVLRCRELWHAAPINAEEFTEYCRKGTFGPEIGLPGRVWASGKPAWIPDVTKDTNFPRASIAVKEELHGAFAAPVLSGSELLGVIEFFSREIREPDLDLLEMMATIGGQIGQFIDRMRAETLLACQKQALEMVVQGTSLVEILELLVKTIEAESSTGLVAAIHLLDRTGSYFHHAIAPSLPESYHRATVITVQSHQGPCCRAVSTGQSVTVPDLASDSQWPAFAALAVSLGLFSCWSTPIFSSEGTVLGTFAIYYRRPNEPGPQDKQLVEIVTRTTAIAIERVQAREALEKSEQTARFLADVSATLSELTDYESTLQRVAGLAVPCFADWCAVDMQQLDGSVRRLAVTHTDPAQVQRAHEFFDRYPPLRTDPYGAMAVLRTGEPEWSATIPDSLLVDTARDEEHLRILRNLGLRSYICVPLRSRTRILGVLTFATAESGRVYDTEDLRAAEDLADRASIAVENASLLAALKETDRRKDEFLAMLAHELRNPLAPISNAVQVIRAKGPAVPELQWARNVIERQVQQLTRLVDDLLDVSRITRGKIELRKQRVELASIVSGAVDASRPLMDKWGHRLAVTLPPEPIYLQADQTRLIQVVLNLLNNAAKYTDPGGLIWLTVEPEGAQVVLRVKDTGIGIPPEMLPRIFDMFTQVDRTLERSQGGLGIGLTLVQRLVELHGGRVAAQSGGPGKGSEFIVRLPVAVETKDRTAEGTTTKGETGTVPAKCRILIVDDNRDSADSLAMILRMMGNEVHTAYDGLEAVEAVAAFGPDVALLDIGLPKLNGYEAGRRIREQHGRSVTLVALTGWGQEEDRRRSKEAGFDYHITKPVELDALQKLLAELPVQSGSA